MKKRKRTVSEDAQEVEKEVMEEKAEETSIIRNTISTGSTLLDLAISGGRKRGGGIPPGIIVEIFGPSSCISKNSFIQYNVISSDGKTQNHKEGTIEGLYNCFHNITVLVLDSESYFRKISKNSYFTAPCMNDKGHVFQNRIRNVIKTGIQECFKVTTESEETIEATKNHKFFDGSCYKKLSDLVEGDFVMIYNKTKTAIVPDKIINIESVGFKETYDITMECPFHNYITQNFVVHNSGKSSLLLEISSSASIKGGQVKFLDPEARLDREYSKIFGIDLKEQDYQRPNTVKELFGIIWNWKPEKEDVINVIAADSLAALSTEMELDDEDKYGMRRAKEFSEGLRKTCRMIANKNWIVVCSNQERDSPNGITTPGGKGIPYYSSLRIRVSPIFSGSKIKKTKTIKGKAIEKVIGVKSICEIKKSSIDEPFRTAPVSIIFGYGIDDVRDMLQWTKDITGNAKYDCLGTEFATMDKAIEFVEKEGLVNKLKERTIDLWMEIEEAFTIKRLKKERF